MNFTVDQYFLQNKIDITDERDRIWSPQIYYTLTASATYSSEICYLYPNGTIIMSRQVLLNLTCPFSYSDMPKDDHICNTVPHLTNEFTSSAVLEYAAKYNSLSN